MSFVVAHLWTWNESKDLLKKKKTATTSSSFDPCQILSALTILLLSHLYLRGAETRACGLYWLTDFSFLLQTWCCERRSSAAQREGASEEAADTFETERVSTRSECLFYLCIFSLFSTQNFPFMLQWDLIYSFISIIHSVTSFPSLDSFSVSSVSEEIEFLIMNKTPVFECRSVSRRDEGPAVCAVTHTPLHMFHLVDQQPKIQVHSVYNDINPATLFPKLFFLKYFIHVLFLKHFKRQQKFPLPGSPRPTTAPFQQY